MLRVDSITDALVLALWVALVVGLPALFLVVISLWNRWVRAHFWESFAMACGLVLAAEAFAIYASCSGMTG